MKVSLKITGSGDDLDKLKKIFLDYEIMGSMNEKSGFAVSVDLGRRSVEDSKALLVDLVNRGFFIDENNLKNLYLPLEVLNLSSRAMKAIKRFGWDIELVGHLTDFSYAEMMNGRSIGRKVVDEVRDKLNEMGFDFGMEIDGFSRKWKS